MRRLTEHDTWHALGEIPGPALLCVTSASCGACRALRAAAPGLSALAGEVTLLEVDAHDSPGIARELEVFHLPAMFLYLDGEYHRPLHSVLRPEAMAQAIRAALALPPEDPP